MKWFLLFILISAERDRPVYNYFKKEKSLAYFLYKVKATEMWMGKIIVIGNKGALLFKDGLEHLTINQTAGNYYDLLILDYTTIWWFESDYLPLKDFLKILFLQFLFIIYRESN